MNGEDVEGNPGRPFPASSTGAGLSDAAFEVEAAFVLSLWRESKDEEGPTCGVVDTDDADPGVGEASAKAKESVATAEVVEDAAPQPCSGAAGGSRSECRRAASGTLPVEFATISRDIECGGGDNGTSSLGRSPFGVAKNADCVGTAVVCSDVGETAAFAAAVTSKSGRAAGQSEARRGGGIVAVAGEGNKVGSSRCRYQEVKKAYDKRLAPSPAPPGGSEVAGLTSLMGTSTQSCRSDGSAGCRRRWSGFAAGSQRSRTSMTARDTTVWRAARERERESRFKHVDGAKWIIGMARRMQKRSGLK